ncbi:A/G-specific adenine glycosylase [Sulfuricystis thermophila]|uniref:A/G-specific adenine glycosylase n=1 Tax=Sulfuricystis thermophila TaxID=2496847 RepID=UPI0010363ECC|nr:A/G-specific adenine glycosylase [Sulfuricystis thermophila]
MQSFAQRLIAWQRRYGRNDLPWQWDWQKLRDPYRVWLAEIMLQQTQVATVIPYYARFVARFPDLAALATASVEEVMALWSGLGYYARARNLHRCAQIIVAQHGGRFPHDPAAIAALPGIGRSTANAIAAVCFGARVAILDGNVKRVLCRHLGIEGFPGSPAVEARLWREAAARLPDRQVPTYLQALMDLGALVCTRSRPRCAACPVSGDCIALHSGRTDELPRARPKRDLPEREITVLVLRQAKRIALERRPPAGIWGGLLSLPELPEHREPLDYARDVLGLKVGAVSPAPTSTHGFTHFCLRIRPLVCDVVAQCGLAETGLHWLDQAELDRAALPAPIRKLLSAIP